MPLYGNELDRAHTPVEAGRGFAVAKQGGFIGAERLLAQLEAGPERRLVGLKVDGKRPPRHGYGVLHGEERVGEVTSGCPSPTSGSGVGTRASSAWPTRPTRATRTCSTPRAVRRPGPRAAAR